MRFITQACQRDEGGNELVREGDYNTNTEANETKYVATHVIVQSITATHAQSHVTNIPC